MGQTDLSSNMSSAELAKRLGDSGLLTAKEISAAMETLAGSFSMSSGGDLAMQLVNAGKLTAFQVRAAMEQRLEELIIGNYEVLERWVPVPWESSIRLVTDA